MTAYYNDIDAYCCKVLRMNIQQGHLPEGTVDERDIKQLHAADFVGHAHVHLFCGIGGFPLGLQRASFPQSIRVLTGGFPCQDISNAGQRAGITGERSGLWKEMYRLIQEAIDCGVAFDYILVENVSALVNRGLSTVLGDLAEAGYDAEWFCVRASDVGAPHQRERVFIVAYISGVRGNTRRSQSKKQRRAPIADRTGSSYVPDSNRSQWGAQSQRGYVYDRNDPRWQEAAGGSVSLRQNDRSRDMADASGARGRVWKQPTGKSQGSQINGGSSDVEHASSARQQECHASTITSDARHTARRSHAAGITGATQPLLGRVLDGLSRGLDRYRWPAGPGVQQHDWEPARVITGKSSHRVARLKALGNSIVPQNIEEIARAILEDREQAG